MTSLRWLASIPLLFAGAALAQAAPVAPTTPGRVEAPRVKLDKHKLSYAIGYQIGSQFAGGDPDVDLAVLLKAVQDAYAKRKPGVSMQDMHDQLRSLEQQMHNHALDEYRQIAAANARKSAAYMQNNGRQTGVLQLPSGVQYAVIKHGEGKNSPGLSSTVRINYRGMLIDGTEFDSSWAHGAPVSYPVSQMIPGWKDVIPRMHVGDRWKVVIPPQLAYGERGQLPRIGPNEALVFEIELLDIQ